ncbi:RluA family pseudouridine synthase [Crocinitomix algicola]|uniref:RluA family pseudouridine synthase n=1 Tax=Crocinitomix algicola TaxID=1740263 RepID=UPI000ACE0D20|nr:RluA family pseudouridine synthase [Crocinitomix algicola]
MKKAIKSGELLLNDRVVEGGRFLKNGDKITRVEIDKRPPKVYHYKLEVLYEDDHFAIVVKPSGIKVSGNQFKTIQNMLPYNLQPSPMTDALPWPLTAHRLDTPTSGLLLIAKTSSTRIALGRDLENKNISKKYYAILQGDCPDEIEINTPINKKTAASTLKKIKAVPSLIFGTLSLVELSPLTGRTHQLRIHCQSINCPILGDKLYGDPSRQLKHKGLFLHAYALTLNHPINQTPISIETPIPHKFKKRMENESRRYLSYRSEF